MTGFVIIQTNLFNKVNSDKPIQHSKFKEIHFLKRVSIV